MLCETEGRIFNKGYKSPLYVKNIVDIQKELPRKCYRLLLFNNGKVLAKKNNKEICITAPALVCLNEEEELYITDGKQEIKSISFHPCLINSILNYQNVRTSGEEFEKLSDEQDRYILRAMTVRDEGYNGIIVLNHESYSVIIRLFENVDMELNEQIDIFWPCRSRSYLIELLILLGKLMYTKEKKEGNNSSEKSDKIKQLISYLHNNYTEKITLDLLTAKFATNRTTLNNEFIKATGSSIIDYLIKLRIDLVCAMLRDTRIPISEIMYRVGYNDSANFWRTLKKTTNMSPSEYRNTFCIVED